MKLSIEQRFEKLVKPSKDGYFIVDFYKNFDPKLWRILERKISLDDIIPSNFKFCEVSRDDEYFYKGKIPHKNYFDIVSREDSGDFDSMFSGVKYKSTIIKDWYIIKPFNKDLLPDSDINTISSWYQKKNELVIKKLYWEKITYFINEYFKKNNSIIDESLFYSLLKQESAFDPNAISHTWTRWLAMVTLSTTKDVISNNKRLLQDKDFLKENSGIEELLITNMDWFKKWSKFYSYPKWFKWVETQFYNPINSIKLSLSYLMSIEKEFNYIKNKDFKKDLVLARYNAWTVVYNIVLKNKNIDSWEKLKPELKNNLHASKYRELVWYVERINKYNI